MFSQHNTQANSLTAITNNSEKLRAIKFNAGVYKFWGADSKEVYEENCRSMPPSHPWHKWKAFDLTYTVNSQHYRTKEWVDIDWENSILVLGCSQIFGVGLDDKQTVPANLENLAQKPVVNLGVPSSSPMLHWINTTILRKHDIKPHAIVYVWTFPQRVTILDKEFLAIHSGNWNTGSDPLFHGWNYYENHGIEFLRYLIESTIQQWAITGCDVLHYTLCNDTAAKLNSVEYLNTNMDLARDQKHIGPICAKNWAENIFSKLNNFRKIE